MVLLKPMVVTETGFICLNDNYCGFETVFMGKNDSGFKVRLEKCTNLFGNIDFLNKRAVLFLSVA